MTTLSLRRVTLCNFCSVKGPLTLDFSNTPAGLYYIWGESKDRLGSNGKGKSTLFTYSIIWALTGSVPGEKRPGAGVETRESSGTTRVDVEFGIDGESTTISRSRNPNGLFINGEKVEQREVDAKLPLTDAALRHSILIDQFGEMFLSLRPEAQSQVFTETLDLNKWLLGADQADQAANVAAKALQRIVADQNGVKRALAEVRDQHEAARIGEEKFETSLEADIKGAKKRLKEAKAEADQRFVELNEARERFTDSDKIAELNNLRERSRTLDRDRGNISRNYSRDEAELESLKEQLAKYGENVQTCPECGQKVDSKHIKERRAVLKAKTEGVEQRKKTVAAEMTRLMEEIQRVNGEITELEEAASSAMLAQTAVSVAAERSQSADREKHRIQAELDALNKRENPFTKSCDALEERVKTLRDELAGLATKETLANVELEMAKFWARGFKEIRLEQLDDALAELEVASNAHIEELGLDGWQISFATERETKQGNVSHGFTVSVYPPGSNEPVSLKSGGEAQRCQLGTTFGLAEVLLSNANIETDFEVLDEPTTHLSPEGVDDLLVCLQDRARDLNRRIFLIDHASLDRGAFDGVITVAKTKDRGTHISDTGGVLSLGKTKRERVIL